MAGTIDCLAFMQSSTARRMGYLKSQYLGPNNTDDWMSGMTIEHRLPQTARHALARYVPSDVEMKAIRKQRTDKYPSRRSRNR
jgi:hypothetical protein